MNKFSKRFIEIIKKFPWIIHTIIFAILILLGANMHPLWGDEAETALFGRSILQHGVPYGWDGTNIMGIEDAVVLNQDLVNHRSPWPQYYLVAGSFALLGESAFSARLPFIVISIFVIPALYYLTLKLTKSKRIALLSVLLTSFSIPLVLYAYQARYYSLNILSGLLLMCAAVSLTEGKMRHKALFIVSGVFYIYNHYVGFAIFYSSLFVGSVAYIFLKKMSLSPIRKFVLQYILLGVVIVLFFMPWYMMLQPNSGGSGGIVINDLFNQGERIQQEAKNTFLPFHVGGVFPFIFIPILGAVVAIRLKGKRDISSIGLISITVIVYIFLVAVLTAISTSGTPFISADRYNKILLPLFLILVSYIFYELWRVKKALFYIAAPIFIFTTVFTLEKPRSFFIEYIGEIVNPYLTPDQVVAAYLKENAGEGDTAFLTLDRDHEPLIFELGKKIIFVNRITPANPRVFPKNRSFLPKYLYFYFDEPDWIVQYGKRRTQGDFYTFDYRPIFPTVNLKENYEEIALPVFFSDLSRPEIELHSFKEVKPDYADQVFIYKKKR